ASLVTPADIALRDIMATRENAISDSSQVDPNIFCPDVDQHDFETTNSGINHHLQIVQPAWFRPRSSHACPSALSQTPEPDARPQSEILRATSTAMFSRLRPDLVWESLGRHPSSSLSKLSCRTHWPQRMMVSLGRFNGRARKPGIAVSAGAQQGFPASAFFQ